MGLDAAHREVWDALQSAAQGGRLGHAILLHGEGGWHKLQLAQALAAALLCQRGQFPACGECHSCRLLAVGNHPDFVHVAPVESSQIRVDQIRELSAQMALRPQLSPRQIALIEPAERMNAAAANALLKTLEEPAADTHLLLVSARRGALPATIRSRCQQWRLGAAVASQASDVAEWLAGGDPEAVTRWSPAELSRVESLAETLLALAQGSVSILAAQARLSEDIEQSLWVWASLLAAARRPPPPGLSPGLGRWLNLTSRLEVSRLWTLTQSLTRARNLRGSGMREDLLLLDLLEQWRQLTEYEMEHQA